MVICGRMLIDLWVIMTFGGTMVLSLYCTPDCSPYDASNLYTYQLVNQSTSTLQLTTYSQVDTTVQAIKDYIVKKHNCLRTLPSPQASNMLEMQWNDEVALGAQQHADNCVFAHNANSNRSTSQFAKCGQNLAYVGGTSPMSWKNTIDLWYNEINSCTDSTASSCVAGDVVGHYTQVNWAKTWQVGCGAKVCSNMVLYACNYCPSGNDPSEPTYVAGTSCTSCSGINCKEGKLCTNHCDYFDVYSNCASLISSGGPTACTTGSFKDDCKATCRCGRQDGLTNFPDTTTTTPSTPTCSSSTAAPTTAAPTTSEAPITLSPTTRAATTPVPTTPAPTTPAATTPAATTPAATTPAATTPAATTPAATTPAATTPAATTPAATTPAATTPAATTPAATTPAATTPAATTPAPTTPAPTTPGISTVAATTPPATTAPCLGGSTMSVSTASPGSGRPNCYNRCDATFCVDKGTGITYNEVSPCSRNYCKCNSGVGTYLSCSSGKYFDGSVPLGAQSCHTGNATWCPPSGGLSGPAPLTLAQVAPLCNAANCGARNGQNAYYALDCCSRYWCYCYSNGTQVMQTCPTGNYFDHRSEWAQCRSSNLLEFCPTNFITTTVAAPAGCATTVPSATSSAPITATTVPTTSPATASVASTITPPVTSTAPPLTTTTKALTTTPQSMSTSPTSASNIRPQCYSRCDTTFCSGKPTMYYATNPCSRNLCYCSGGAPNMYGCSSTGQYFDEASQSCMTPSSSFCPSAGNSSAPAPQPLSAVQGMCNAQNCADRLGSNAFYPLECCSQYWCYCYSNGTIATQACPAGQYFDHRSEWVQCRPIVNFEFCAH